MLLNVLIGSARCGRRREKPDADARRLTGEIIEESLADSSVLSKVIVLDSRVEPVTEYHRTPWLER